MRKRIVMLKDHALWGAAGAAVSVNAVMAQQLVDGGWAKWADDWRGADKRLRAECGCKGACQ